MITSPLTIIGAGATRTIIERADSAPPLRLVYVSSGPFSLEGLTLRGGNALLRPGSGLDNAGATVTIMRSTFDRNFTSRVGGLFNDHGTVTIMSSIFTNHTDAGAVRSDGGMLVISDTTFAGNVSDFGGAVAMNGRITEHHPRP